jgi:hypothetical protein
MGVKIILKDPAYRVHACTFFTGGIFKTPDLTGQVQRNPPMVVRIVAPTTAAELFLVKFEFLAV